MKEVSEMIKLRVTGTVSVSTGTILPSGVYLSDAFDASQLQGNFSLQWTITGAGTLKIEVLVSNDGVNFHELDADIAVGQLVGTGMAAFDVTVCNQLKLKFTETAGADPIVVTARLRAA
jgi:hypothetical protein